MALSEIALQNDGLSDQKRPAHLSGVCKAYTEVSNASKFAVRTKIVDWLYVSVKVEMQKTASGIFGVVLVVAIFCVSCSFPLVSMSKEECPVTTSKGSFNSSDDWFGEMGGLRVLIVNDGIWSDFPRNDYGSVQIKLSFKYPDLGDSLKPFPYLNIVGNRLNGVDNFEYTELFVGANAPELIDGWAIFSTNLTLRESGCWEITGNYKEDRVIFIGWIEP